MGITAEIYQTLNRAEALKDLEPKVKGSYLELKCPSCGEREAFIYHTGTHIKCNRANKCTYSASIFEYVKTSKGHATNLEVIKDLAKLANYSLDLNSYNEEKAQAMLERESILETALDFFKKSLNKQALGYLTDERKYTAEEISFMELGYIPSLQALKDYLVNTVNKVYSVNTVNIFNEIFTDSRVEGRIVIPYRDYIGTLQGFSFRAIGKEEPKYLNSTGLKPSEQFFNLDKNRGEKKLVVVEGYLDSLIATARGLDGFVSIGTAGINDQRLDNAIKCGAKYFYLALDTDKAGQDAIKRFIEKINSKEARAYVVSLPEGFKDPDEYLRKHTTDELSEIIKNAQSGSKWVANSLLSKHGKQSKHTDQERDEIILDALSYEETLSDPIDSKDFIDTITNSLEIPLELLEPKIKDYHDKKAKQRQEASYRGLQQKASQLLADGKTDELTKLYREELPSITAKGVSRIIEPYSLDRFTQDLQNKKDGLKTGFKELDKYATIPQEAITIIAGRPGQGKTTTLLNIFLNFIRTYQEKRFFFFSYEETQSQLAIKCLNILAQEELDQYKNIQHLEAYIKEGKEDKVRIENAKAQYKELTDSGRLWLIEESYYVNDLADTILFLTEKFNNVGAIFIDYIQKIKITGKFPSRQVEIQKISEKILEVAKQAHLPIILGAQLNRESKENKDVRLSNLRESGDIEQDANLVLGIINHTMDEAEDSGEPTKDKEIDLEIKILKNRNGVTGQKATVTFNRPLLTLKDPHLINGIATINQVEKKADKLKQWSEKKELKEKDLELKERKIKVEEEKVRIAKLKEEAKIKK